MAEPADMILPLLRDIRVEMNQRFDGVDRRLDAVEAAQKSFRQALTGDSLLSKLVTGEFEQQRIEALERKIQELEAHK